MTEDIVSYQLQKYSERQVLASKLLSEKKTMTPYAESEELKMGTLASVRNVQMLQFRHPKYTARVSVTPGHYSRSQTGYIEVSVDCSNFKTSCPCKYHEEVGLNCPHVKAVLLHLEDHGVGCGWIDRRFHLSTYASSYGADIPGMCVTGKLQADSSFCPPDYKRSAGRPKKRKDRAHMRTTEIRRECKACGELGHFAVSCPHPSTQFRYYKHKENAIQWCKSRENISVED